MNTTDGHRKHARNERTERDELDDRDELDEQDELDDPEERDEREGKDEEGDGARGTVAGNRTGCPPPRRSAARWSSSPSSWAGRPRPCRR